MPLPPSSDNAFVVLGTLRLGAKSGYEVKLWIERSASFFWRISPVQIYPALKWLEDQRLVTGRDDPRGARARRTYKVTPAGERALRDWLRSPGDLTFELRDRGLLKLFFADILDPRETLEHVQAMGRRASDELRRFRTDIKPASLREELRHDLHFPRITAQFAIEFYEWIVSWCERLERELTSSQRSGASRRRRSA